MKKKNIIIIVIAALLVLAGAGYWYAKKGETTEDTDTIKIGAILPLTGDLAKYGESGKQGLNIALKEFKNIHPDLKVSIVIEDDKGETKTAISAVHKLHDIDKVNMIIGSMSSGVTLGIAPTINSNKIVLMAPTSTASEITNAGDYIFRVCVSDAFEGKSMAEFISKTYNDKRIAVIYINNDYGVGLKNNFTENCSRLNLNIDFETGYNANTKDFKTIINTLKSKQIDLIYIVAQKEQIDFFTQCKEMKYRPQITASTMLEDEDLFNKLGTFLDGAVYTYRSFDPQRKDKIVQEFMIDYERTYGKMPDFYAASVFDATRVCLHSMFDSKIHGINVKDYLYQLKEYPCVTGTISFDENGDVTQGFSIKQINNGKPCFIQ